MKELLNKLNWKEQQEVFLFQVPLMFEPMKRECAKTARVVEEIEQMETIEFSLAFVSKQYEVDTLVPAILEKASGDYMLWFCYPKGTSKTIKSEINRDKGWDQLKQVGFDTVRLVSLNEDWSALRYRKTAYIKTYTRNK